MFTSCRKANYTFLHFQLCPWLSPTVIACSKRSISLAFCWIFTDLICLYSLEFNKSHFKQRIVSKYLLRLQTYRMLLRRMFTLVYSFSISPCNNHKPSLMALKLQAAFGIFINRKYPFRVVKRQGILISLPPLYLSN